MTIAARLHVATAAQTDATGAVTINTAKMPNPTSISETTMAIGKATPLKTASTELLTFRTRYHDGRSRSSRNGACRYRSSSLHASWAPSSAATAACEYDSESASAARRQTTTTSTSDRSNTSS